MNIFWGIVVIVVSLAVLVFSSMSIYEQFIQYGEWWEASVATFGLLGILLTAGAAFATVAAVISYFSVNDKLKKAEADLDIAKESLANFRKLDDERKTLEDANNKLKEYKAAVQSLENKNVTDNSDLQKHIEFVLKSPNALFQDRLRANAIQSDINAEKKIESKEYKKAIELSEHSKECWKVLFLYNPEQNVANYTKAMFNLAYSYNELDTKNYTYIYQLYQEIITLSDKYNSPNLLIENAYNNWGTALDDEANAIQSTDLASARALWQSAGEKYAKAVGIKGDMHEAYYNWGTALDDEANAIQLTDLASARALWQSAGEKYAKAVGIKGDMHEAYYNWGTALDDEANAIQLTDLASARALWQSAGEKYAKAVGIKGDMHEAYYNWGTALDDEANAIQLTDLASARALWQSAGEKYAKAVGIKGDMHEAYYNWGTALDDEANAIQLTDLASARALWQSAGEKYAKAVGIKGDKHEAYNNWGTALAKEADAIQSTDLASARALWQAAGEKYAKAVGIKGNMHEAYNNWGSALLDEANAISYIEPQEALQLRKKAKVILTDFVTKYPHFSGKMAYNLGCIFAHEGNVQEVIKQFEIAREANVFPSKEHIEKDSDLDGVRETPEFQAWFNKTFKE